MAEVSVRTLGRNSAYGLVAQLWRMGSRFILTPLIIAQIDLEGYGVWVLLFSLCAYVNVVDTTFSIAYSKLTAECDAKRDYRALGLIIGSGMAFVGSIAALALAVVWLFHVPILKTLGVPDAALSQAGSALLLVMVCVLMRMGAGCVFQVLAGLQRLDLRYKLGILASVIEFVISVVLLLLGWGLLGLAVGHFCGQVVATAVAWYLCRRLCPELRISPFMVSAWGLRRIVSLGGRFQALSVLQLIMTQGIKMLISGLLGVSMLAIYEIAYKLLSLGGAVAGAVIAPLMPAFAKLHAGEDHRRFRSLYERGSKLVAAACMPCFAFLAIFADRLILLWTAEEYPVAAWTVRWMAVSFFAVLLTGVGTASLRGRGTVRLEFWFGLINVGLLAGLLGPGYWLWGYEGIVAAIAVGIFLGSSWFIVSFARQESLDLVRYLRTTLLRPMLVLGPVIVLTAVLEPVLHLPLSLVSPRWAALADVALWGALFSLVVAVCGWFGLLSPSERTSIARCLPGRRPGADLGGVLKSTSRPPAASDSR